MNSLKYILIFFISLYGCQSFNAQTFGEYKVKQDNFGVKPKKKASKEIYINSFNVMVEVYREDVDYKAKREFRGQGRAEALASAAMGVKGIDAAILQNKVDELYNEMLTDLQSKGFTILQGNAAIDTDYYKNATAFNGPIVRESANPGMLEIVPSEFRGFTSPKNAEGKKSNKSGLFPGLKSAGKFARNTNMLSKQLNDAIVLDVNLAMTWSETGGSWVKQLGGANAKIKTNLALGEKAVSAPKKKGVRLKGAEDYYIIPNDFTVAQGSGLKKVTWRGYLKKPIEINGVLDEIKVEADNKGAMSQSYDVGNLWKVTEWTSTVSSKTKFVEVDANKFADALFISGKTFINDQLNYLYDQYF